MSWREQLPAGDPAISTLRAFLDDNPIDRGERGWRERLPAPPACEFDGERAYYWNLETSHGDLRIRLLPEEAPRHVSSTIYLTLLGFYDDLTFHRVIPEFMAQGGCPRGTGTGGPGYEMDGEFGSRKHDRPGLLSMANAGPGTDGSQFFLTFVPTPWLDGKHTIFGEVTDGMDTLAELEKRGSSPQGRPTERLLLKRASISIE